MPINLQHLRTARHRLGRLVLCLGLFVAPSLPLAAQLDYAEKVSAPGQVVLDTRGIFTLGGASAPDLAARTALVQSRLNRILSKAQAPTVTTVREPAGWALMLNGQLLVTVTQQDTAKHNTSTQALAKEWAGSLRSVLKDQTLLDTHLEFNSAPDWVSLGGIGYSRTDKELTPEAKPASSGYSFRRNLIFVDQGDANPEQVYLRGWDGRYVVYERLRAPQNTDTPQ